MPVLALCETEALVRLLRLMASPMDSGRERLLSELVGRAAWKELERGRVTGERLALRR